MRLLLLLICCAFATGCDHGLEIILEPDAVRHRAEYAIPLVDSRTALPELTGIVDERVTLTIDPDGLLRFHYIDTVPPVTSGPLFNQLAALGRGIPLPITRRREALPFPLPADISLDELRVRRGQFTYYLPNTYDRPVRITLEIPNATRGGEAFRVTGELPAHTGNGTPPLLSNAANPLDFAGYALDFSSDSLLINYAINDLDGTPLEPAPGTVTALSNLEFSYIEGYFGRSTYPGVSDVLEIDFFKNYVSGSVSFVNPLIRVEVRNGFGVPSRAAIEELYVTTVTGERIDVTGEVVTNGFPFDYPTTEGENAYTTYLIDERNSNVLDLISANPVALHYRIGALLNPDADAGITGFLADTSTYTATLEVELPTYGSASDFTVRDSFPLDLGDKYGDVSAATFRITTDNNLPLDLSVIGTFVDARGNALVDLTDGALLVVSASPVDTAGNPTESRQTTTDITFTGDRLERLREANQLILQTAFATPSPATTNVRITNDQDLRIRVGVRLTVNNP
ncbi:hypothetical protein [Lewinella sp. JB7]|uniref:hypothetical protein n=1 Tax=Lewinella sp. JB7 TaxID=2962887 RepID=UPI0020C9C18B|nr:hypothetical protein [Lewinella sp. JB7]MCP9234371.1 hypothetical protein [Lewinella sp. JB7]